MSGRYEGEGGRGDGNICITRVYIYEPLYSEIYRTQTNGTKTRNGNFALTERRTRNSQACCDSITKTEGSATKDMQLSREKYSERGGKKERESAKRALGYHYKAQGWECVWLCRREEDIRCVTETVITLWDGSKTKVKCKTVAPPQATALIKHKENRNNEICKK